MEKKKIVLFGALMIVPILVPMFLANVGWHLTSEQSTLFFLFFASCLVIGLLLDKKTQKWAIMIPLTFLLLFGSAFVKARKNEREDKKTDKTAQAANTRGNSVILTTTPPYPAPATRKPSDVIKTSWGYVINFTAAEPEGTHILTAEQDMDFPIRWIEDSGSIHDPDDPKFHLTDPWGYDFYTMGWKQRFKFSWCQGVRSHAILVLKKKPDESLNDLRQENIFFFDKEKKEKEFKVHMNSGEELVLYYHDVDDPFYLKRNGADGSSMRFEVVLSE